MDVKKFYEIIGGNYEDALSRLMNDSLIERFVKMFAEKQSIELLKNEIMAKNWDTAFKEAHTLKGVVLNLSFAKLGDKIVKLTDFLRPENKANFDENLALTYYFETEKEFKMVIENIRD